MGAGLCQYIGRAFYGTATVVSRSLGHVRLSRLSGPMVRSFMDKLLEDGKSTDLASRLKRSLGACWLTHRSAGRWLAMWCEKPNASDAAMDDTNGAAN
jgi:hypothetical protein